MLSEIGYPHQYIPDVYVAEPRAGCLICGRDNIAVVSTGDLRQHKVNERDPITGRLRLGPWCSSRYRHR